MSDQKVHPQAFSRAVINAAPSRQGKEKDGLGTMSTSTVQMAFPSLKSFSISHLH